MNRTKFFSSTWKVAMVGLVALMSILVSNVAHGQGVRLNLYGGYVFDDKFDTYYSSSSYYEGKIKGGFQWGIGVEYMVQPQYGIELLYLRQDTEAPTRYYGVLVGSGGNRDGEVNLDLAINYILLAPTKHFVSSNEKVEGFAGFMAGMVIAEASTPDGSALGTGEDSATKFAWGVRLGGIIWASEKVGIRLQTQLLSAAQAMGGGFTFGTGGAGAGVSSYSTIYQFGLGGGLVFKVK